MKSLPFMCIALASCNARDRAMSPMLVAAEQQVATQPATKPIPARKIIRNGEVVLEVDSLERARGEAEAATRLAGGYVSSAQSDDSSQALVLRIPAARFDDVAHGLARLGRVLRESLTAEEITDQYYDLTARLTNAKRLEARLLDLVAQKTSRVSELLEVERELGRVREEIERLEGKQRLWDQEVALGTLSVRLWRHAPPEAITTALGTLRGSWHAMVAAGRGAFLGGVAVLPWSPFLAAVIFLLIRWRRRSTALPQ